MQLNILVNNVFNGWEPTDIRLGGTEESVVHWAEELARRGHQVTVYRNGRNAPKVEGFDLPAVTYLERDRYEGGGDICINIKSADIEPKEPTLYLTNETDATKHDLSKYLGIIWPSHWAADNIEVNNDNLFILPHGYDHTAIYPGQKTAKQCFYASSPDRGLDVLLQAWPRVYAAHPDATLIVTYGGQSNLPGVINLGEIDEDTMNDVYRSSDIWCHPCTGGELYCMVGKKAQAAACIPVIIPTMALAETVARGFKVDTPDNYAKTLIEVLSLPMEARNAIRKDVLEHAYTPNWVQSTDILLGIINSVLK